MPQSIYFRGLESFTIPDDAPIIERAVSRLRNAIMSGELRPGQKLVEAELCRTLDVSRASIREALRALEVEKLVELIPNRGPSVSRLGYQEVEAIHEVWALLTGAVVYDFTKIAGPEDIAELEKALAALRQAIADNAPLQQLAATNSFFLSILQNCGNSVMTDVVTSLVSRVNFLRAQALLYRGWGILYAEEISDIVTAIRNRNPEAARTATHKHIASACAAAKQLTAAPEMSPAQADPGAVEGAAPTVIAERSSKRSKAASKRVGKSARPSASAV
jgi:DNA-binding GntR family transcriptional regulator